MSSPLQVFKSNLFDYSTAVAGILKDEKARGYANRISRMTNKQMGEYANDWYSQTSTFEKEIASGSHSDMLARDDCPAVIQEMCIKEAFAVGDDVYKCDEFTSKDEKDEKDKKKRAVPEKTLGICHGSFKAE